MTEFRSFPAFKHALATTVRNLSPSVRMAWPWMLPMMIIQLIPVFVFNAIQPMPESGYWNAMAPSIALLIWIFSFLGVSSIAVNLHRFVLLGDEARGWYKFRLDRLVWRYIGNFVLIQLGIAFSALVVTGVLWLAYHLLSLTLPEWISVVLVGAAGIACILLLAQSFMRLSSKLPAVALGYRDYGFRRAWDDSRGKAWGIVGFWLILVLFMLAVLAVLFLPLTGVYWRLGPGTLPVALIFYGVQFVANWFLMILGVIMLTTQYSIVAEDIEA